MMKQFFLNTKYISLKDILITLMCLILCSCADSVNQVSSSNALGDSDIPDIPEYNFVFLKNDPPLSQHEKALFQILGKALADDTELPTELKTGTPIIEQYVYEDFDGDGTKEIFAKVSDFLFQPWFVTDSGAIKLYDSVMGSTEIECAPSVIIGGNQKFATLSLYNGSKTQVAVYGLRGGVVFVPSISRMGVVIEQDSPDEVRVIRHAYDASADGAGLTLKPYYFFYEDGDFKEYGGIEITLEDLYGLNGTAEILGANLTEYDEIKSVYYRGNGIININHCRQQPDEPLGGNGYITLRYDGSKANFETVGTGIYEAACYTSVAVFPESFIGR